MTTTIAPRYDVQAITITKDTISYGLPVAYNVTMAIGPVAHDGEVLVDTGKAIRTFYVAQLRTAY
jgi:hypothetical protein